MFSRLEPLFLQTFRQAEMADTRQEIREEHKDNRRSSDDSDDNTQNEQDLWTDNTSVSVLSLKAFLVSFLREQIEQDHNDESRKAMPDTQSKPIINSRAGQAAMAYQTAQNNQKNDYDIQSRNETANISVPDGVKSEDVRIINRLIRNLDELARAGVTELSIPKADSFLHSLELAVKNAKF